MNTPEPVKTLGTLAINAAGISLGLTAITGMWSEFIWFLLAGAVASALCTLVVHVLVDRPRPTPFRPLTAEQVELLAKATGFDPELVDPTYRRPPPRAAQAHREAGSAAGKEFGEAFHDRLMPGSTPQHEPARPSREVPVRHVGAATWVWRPTVDEPLRVVCSRCGGATIIANRTPGLFPRSGGCVCNND
jgi:hypothetical protein